MKSAVALQRENWISSPVVGRGSEEVMSQAEKDFRSLTREVRQSLPDIMSQDDQKKVSIMEDQARRYFKKREAIKSELALLGSEVEAQNGVRNCDDWLAKEFFKVKDDFKQASGAFNTVLESYRLTVEELTN